MLLFFKKKKKKMNNTKRLLLLICIQKYIEQTSLRRNHFTWSTTFWKTHENSFRAQSTFQLSLARSSHRRFSVKKDVLKNLANFTEKHLR